MGLKSRSGLNGTHDRILQDDQCLGGLNFINCLDLVDKYMLESIDRTAHHFYKDAVVAGCVIGFSDFIEAFQLCQRGRIVFGAL